MNDFDDQDRADAERQKEEDEFRAWLKALENDPEYQRQVQELTNAS